MHAGAPVPELPQDLQAPAAAPGVAALRAWLRAALMRGYAIAAEVGGVIAEWVACPGNVDGEVGRLAGCSTMTESVARWVRSALKTALVQGVGLYEEAAATGRADTGPEPASMFEALDLTLRLLVSTLEAAGIVVPGADLLRPEIPAVPALPEGERWEARSRWVPEKVTWYRLILRRTGEEVRMTRERPVGPEELIASLPAVDAGAVLAMLRVVGLVGIADD